MQNIQQSTERNINEFIEKNLISSGSKLSAKEIYKRQIELPLYGLGNQYYKAEDVDNLFTIFNGVISSMSEETERTKKVNDDIRKELEISNTVNNDLAEQVVYLKSQMETLQYALNDVSNSQASSDELLEARKAYTDLVESVADKMTEAQEVLSDLSMYKDQLDKEKSLNTQLMSEIEEKNTKLSLLSIEKSNGYSTIENQNAEILAYQSQINDLNSQINTLKSQNDDLNSLINVKIKEVNGLTKENSMLKFKIGRVIDASRHSIEKALATRNK